MRLRIRHVCYLKTKSRERRKWSWEGRLEIYHQRWWSNFWGCFGVGWTGVCQLGGSLFFGEMGISEDRDMVFKSLDRRCYIS